MTKVKTILAEFCSPKEILAINRLGLLKKEERESQPIPWRHRLKNSERRELVRSELRMCLRPPSRTNARDKVKAISTAQNPKESKMGECLLNINIRGDPCLQSHLGRISREQKRYEHSSQQTRHSFMRRSQCLSHEPMILVEREPTATVKTRAAFFNKYGIDPEIAIKPSFMRPLQSKARTPNILTTIEAFAVETKKKRNLWEEVMDEKETPKFKVMARPSAPLTDYEKSQLQLGHALHKPTPESIAAMKEEEPEEAPAPPPPQPRPTTTGSSVFITQLPEQNVPKPPGRPFVKSVTFLEIMLDNKKGTSVSSKSSTPGRRDRPNSRENDLKLGRSILRMGARGDRGDRCKSAGGKSQSKNDQSLLVGREKSEKKLKDFLSVLMENC